MLHLVKSHGIPSDKQVSILHKYYKDMEAQKALEIDNLKIQKALEIDNLKIQKALEMDNVEIDNLKIQKALEMDKKALEIDHLKTKLDFTRKELLRTAGLLSSRGILEFYAKRIMCEIKPKTITATLAAAYEYQQMSSAAKDLAVCVTECRVPK